MSRSVKKTPIFGITYADSEKQNKRRWNRTFRKVCKHLLKKGIEAPKRISAVTEVWDGNKDGKRYWRGAVKKDMRK
jgi:hypothetical protein